MKINIIAPAIGNSGGIDVIYRYAYTLKELGNDVLVYKSIKANNMHRYKSCLLNIVHQFYCSIKILLNIQKNKKDVDCFVTSITNKTIRNADVTIATSWPTSYLVNKLSNKKGRKFYFIQGFEIWDNRDYGLNSYKLPLNKIVISTWLNEQLKKELEIGPFPVVYNGIDTKIFYDRRTRDDSTKIFLMLNHTLEKKGVKYGIKVFERIKEKYPDAQLKMFGMCDRSNLPDCVEYYQNPSKEQLLTLYNTANYFLFPSLEEGWGLTPIEAMACGCIVCGTNTGFVLDIGKHQENMMISEPGDVDGMVKNIEKAINSPYLREEIRKNSKKSVEDLSWDKSTEKLNALLMG